jgi:hypothetical protein
MNDFRGPLPLDDRDFAEVRRNVKAKLERHRIAPVVFRFATVAAAAIVLAIIFLPRSQPLPNAPPPAVTRPYVQPQITQPVPTQLAPQPKAENRRAAPRHKTGSPPPDSEITMNIQTADPNIRIIWIAR